MSWRDRMQPGSIRGVPFHTQSVSGSGGRRIALHQYPQQEEHWPEDLGAEAENETLELYCIGADYDLERNALLQALRTPGPATLVHPYLGTMEIQVGTYNWTISSKQGGYCKFSVQYYSVGERKYPADSQRAGHELAQCCDSAAADMQRVFAEQFSVLKRPQFVVQAALDHLNHVSDILVSLSGANSPLAPVSGFVDQVGEFQGQLQQLIGKPAQLAAQLNGLVVGMFPSTIQGSTAVFNSLSARVAVPTPVVATTPSRRAQVKNQGVLDTFVQGAASVELARKSAAREVSFATYADAINTRDAVLAQFDKLAEQNSGDYGVLVNLQAATMRRIDELAPGLQRIERITLAQPLPALVLAHRLYQDANRADEMVIRNSVVHPGFVPAGVELEVLR